MRCLINDRPELLQFNRSFVYFSSWKTQIQVTFQRLHYPSELYNQSKPTYDQHGRKNEHWREYLYIYNSWILPNALRLFCTNYLTMTWLHKICFWETDIRSALECIGSLIDKQSLLILMIKDTPLLETGQVHPLQRLSDDGNTSSTYRRSTSSTYRRSISSTYRRSTSSTYRRSISSTYRRSTSSTYRRDTSYTYRRNMKMMMMTVMTGMTMVMITDLMH